jgi:hypothetical protein
MAQDAYLTDQALLAQNPEAADLSRQRKLAEMLTLKAFEQPQGGLVSGHYVAPSWTQQLAPLVSGIAGQTMNKQLDEKQLALAEALRGKQQEVMQAYANAKTPQEKFAIGTSEYAPTQLKAAMYDRLKTQKVGADESLVAGDINGYSPIFTGPSALSGEVKTAAQLLGINKPRDQWTAQELAAVDAKAQQMKRAGASNLTVHTGNALGGEIGKGVGQEDVALRAAAKNSQLTVDNADAALKNLDKAIVGPNADIRLQAAKYLNVAGADNAETIKASEQAFAQRGQALLGRVKSSGLAGSQGLTEGERKFLTSAYGGNLNLDKETLKGMLMLEKRLAQRDAKMWNERLTELPQEVVKGAGLKGVAVPNLGEIDANNPLLK